MASLTFEPQIRTSVKFLSGKDDTSRILKAIADIIDTRSDCKFWGICSHINLNQMLVDTTKKLATHAFAILNSS